MRLFQARGLSVEFGKNTAWPRVQRSRSPELREMEEGRESLEEGPEQAGSTYVQQGATLLNA